jgi:TolA-binding protein
MEDLDLALALSLSMSLNGPAASSTAAATSASIAATSSKQAARQALSERYLQQVQSSTSSVPSTSRRIVRLPHQSTAQQPQQNHRQQPELLDLHDHDGGDGTQQVEVVDLTPLSAQLEGLEETLLQRLSQMYGVTGHWLAGHVLALTSDSPAGLDMIQAAKVYFQSLLVSQNMLGELMPDLKCRTVDISSKVGGYVC